MNKIQTRVSLSISYVIYIIHIILILLILHTINNVYISCTLEKRNKNKYAIDTITRDTQKTEDRICIGSEMSKNYSRHEHIHKNNA